MTIKEMHYDYKLKMNKVDSQKYANMLIPEIDWILNEAEDILVKAVAFPKQNKILGFEINQRIKDDLRSLVVEQLDDENSCLSVVKINDLIYKAAIPNNYRYYIKSNILATKGTCKRELTGLSKNHGNLDSESPFDNASFEWEETNILFVGDNLHIYTDKSFVIDKICLGYYRKSLYMHNAEDYRGGKYKKHDGTILTGFQNCELPDTVRRDIVDIAVLITTGNLIGDYNVKLQKVKITE